MDRVLQADERWPTTQRRHIETDRRSCRSADHISTLPETALPFIQNSPTLESFRFTLQPKMSFLSPRPGSFAGMTPSDNAFRLIVEIAHLQTSRALKLQKPESSSLAMRRQASSHSSSDEGCGGVPLSTSSSSSATSTSEADTPPSSPPTEQVPSFVFSPHVFSPPDTPRAARRFNFVPDDTGYDSELDGRSAAFKSKHKSPNLNVDRAPRGLGLGLGLGRRRSVRRQNTDAPTPDNSPVPAASPIVQLEHAPTPENSPVPRAAPVMKASRDTSIDRPNRPPNIDLSHMQPRAQPSKKSQMGLGIGIGLPSSVRAKNAGASTSARAVTTPTPAAPRLRPAHVDAPLPSPLELPAPRYVSQPMAVQRPQSSRSVSALLPRATPSPVSLAPPMPPRLLSKFASASPSLCPSSPSSPSDAIPRLSPRLLSPPRACVYPPPPYGRPQAIPPVPPNTPVEQPPRVYLFLPLVPVSSEDEKPWVDKVDTPGLGRDCLIEMMRDALVGVAECRTVRRKEREENPYFARAVVLPGVGAMLGASTPK
ncbi:hypothetical protein EXIGLDRAFT_127821 [Exidia glandulosa HHB12029]|uniref:Uncharacterized protein n=1 Tax=Exidia glandulosa HHB12029 TaxID=1314781 RepID=A0A165G9B7_EXIGL|nr:hypothetical protein EXIGLDRAFT_127821 [Exidia glandulosa HHB12029]